MYTGGVMTIEGKLAGHPEPLNFILDTGSGGISVDSATCKELGLHAVKTDTVVTGIAGERKVEFVFDQKLFTGSVATDHLNFYVNDYSLLTSTYGEKIDGVIGFSFLSKYIFDINFDSLQLKIFSAGKFNYENNGKTLRPSFKRLVAQPLTISDHKRSEFKFYLDSGAGLCLLMSDRFAKDSNIISPRRKPVYTQAEGLGGKNSVRLTVAKLVKIGPFRFKNVPVHLYNDENDIFSYPYSGGLIGNDLLRRFNVVLNYPAGEIHLTPNGHFIENFDYAYTGMSLFMIEGKVYIDDIVPGSPAALTGLKDGDELMSVGGNVSGNVQEFKNLLQKTGNEIPLVIKRKEETYLINIRPKSIR